MPRAAPQRAFAIRDRGYLRIPLCDWSGNVLDKSRLDRLREGDCVRLVLCDPDNGPGCEAIYFEITGVSYYTEGITSRPRSFRGRAMNTYRMLSENELRYVKTGEEISFQRSNIVEIPSWRLGEAPGIAPQPRKDLIAEELARIRTAENRVEREAWEAERLRLKEEKRRRKAATTAAVFIAVDADGDSGF
eukprot:Opistho-2@51049